MVILFLVSAAKESKLKEISGAGDLAKFDLSQFPSSQVQVSGKEKQLATAGKETSYELSLSSLTTSPLPFQLCEHLSCQLMDLHHQHMHCVITFSQPGVCTVKYTPTLGGPHQLRITMRDDDISGSPLTIQVLPSSEIRDAVQHNITGLNRPWGVAVSKSGEVVVSENNGHRISVYDRKWQKIRSFGSKGSSTGQFRYPCGVAITSDNYILVADGSNNRIQMFTMEGKFVKSVGQKGDEPLQFNYPLGIAVHPSGSVFVADSSNHRIQVLNQDLSFSSMFGRKGSALGWFNHPNDVAINSSGVVYVTDYYNHRVQLFSANGQFNSSLGSEESQFYKPNSVSIDSTNTVYITNENYRLSVYNSSGQFIKNFGTDVLDSHVNQLDSPVGIAIDNTTGALYVCDWGTNSVVVY